MRGGGKCVRVCLLLVLVQALGENMWIGHYCANSSMQICDENLVLAAIPMLQLEG